MQDHLQRAREIVRKRTVLAVKTGIILGSGLGDSLTDVKIDAEVDYGELPGFPVSTNENHAGKLLIGTACGVPVAIMQGRVHFYEGYSPEEIALPVRLLRLLGAEILLQTNCSGGIAPNLHPGDLVLLRDHLSFLVPSPLRGKNDAETGPRFPEMTDAYDPELLAVMKCAAREEGIEVKEGIYIQTPGPQLETPAEIRAFRSWGADLVGMSTVTETIAARHCGMRVCALSCVANPAAGLGAAPLSIEEIFSTVEQRTPVLGRLLSAFLRKIA